MNWPEFEQDMKNMVDGHETPVDTDVLWDKIQEKRRKRRGLLWFWSGGVVLLLGGLGWWYSTGKIRGTAFSAVVQEVGTGERVGSQNSVSDGMGAGKQVQNQVQGQIQEQNQVQKQKQNQESTQGGLSAQIPDRVDLNVAVYKNENSNTAAPAIDLVLSSAASSGTEFAGVKNAIPTVLAPLPLLRQLPVWPEQTLVSPKKTLVFTPEKKGKNNSLSPIIACNSGYYKWRSIGAIPDRFSTSRNLETVQGAMHLMLPLSAHWAVQTGISYARTTSRITWVRSWEEQKAINPKNFYADGSIDFDTANVTFLMRREINHYNHWTQIGLPLGMEYRFRFGKTYLTPQVGLQFNYLLPVKGLANDANHNLSAKVFAAHFQRKFLLQGQAGFEFGYNMNEKWSITAGPHLQFDVMPRTTAGVSHPERFFMYGLQLGLRRNLIFN